MARILLGWELGAFRGHAVRLTRFGRVLRAAGHSVNFAFQRPDLIEPLDGGAWQAPIWPRLLVGTPRPPAGLPATLGDILARLGLADPGAFGGLVRAWDGIMAATRPDLVIADYAPALLAAARGRVATICTGSGFDTPPAALAQFPNLTGSPALHDEAALLVTVNADLAAVDRAPLERLPGLFAADRCLPNGLDELDPYALWRPDGMTPPLLDLPLTPIGPAEEEELFVYWPTGGHGSRHMWEGVARAGMPVRLYAPGLADADLAALAGHGFAVERAPLRWGEIARRSRLVLSHGGTGFAIAALMHGRPQLIVHADLEKAGNGLAIERLGLGRSTPLGDFDVAAFADTLAGLHADPALAARAQAQAAVFRGRLRTTPEALVVQAVADLT